MHTIMVISIYLFQKKLRTSWEQHWADCSLSTWYITSTWTWTQNSLVLLCRFLVLIQNSQIDILKKICSQRDSHQCINSRNIKCRPKVAQITKKNAESPWKNFEAPRRHVIIKTVETSSQTDAVKTFEKHWQYCETLREIS